MSTRPIYLPGAIAHDCLRLRVSAALDAWAGEWVSRWTQNDRRLVALHLCAAGDVADVQKYEYDSVGAEEGCMWFRRGAGDRFNCSRAVVGDELMPRSACADDWIAGITDHAWNTRNRELCAVLLGVRNPEVLAAPATPPSSLFAFGSGAVYLSCDALGLHAIADNAIWHSMPSAGKEQAHRLPQITPLDRAACAAKVALDVMLGTVEIDLPKLMDLRHGDVLRLSQRLNQGLAVLCEGRPLARAVLGASRGRMCVQIISNHP